MHILVFSTVSVYFGGSVSILRLFVVGLDIDVCSTRHVHTPFLLPILTFMFSGCMVLRCVYTGDWDCLQQWRNKNSNRCYLYVFTAALVYNKLEIAIFSVLVSIWECISPSGMNPLYSNTNLSRPTFLRTDWNCRLFKNWKHHSSLTDMLILVWKGFRSLFAIYTDHNWIFLLKP